MRILFVLRHSGYLRLFESTIRELADRGHELRLVFTASQRSRIDRMTADVAERLSARGDISVSPWTASNEAHASRDPRLRLQWWQDYLRYFEPALADASKLRDRAGGRLSPEIHAASKTLAKSPELLAVVRQALAVTERSLATSSPESQRLLVDERPDLVAITPLFDRTGTQTEIARTARAAGTPVVLCCSSWDNLTTAGLIHAELDAVTVWNAAQRDEAVHLHGVPADRVAVTGAPVYDVWFEARSTRTREEWCAETGLDAARPYLLYVCSSGFIAPDEDVHIARWVQRLRASSDPDLCDAQILVRPHPQHPLDRARLSRLPGVCVHPRSSELPVGEASRARYVDAIHHCAAVVGVNTSAMIESAIFGRGVHVHLTKRYRQTQGGTPHFRHLLVVGGGLLKATASLDEHHAGLGAALRGDDAEDTAARARAFLGDFVRPAGLDRPATPLLATAIEAVAARAATEPAEADPLGVGRAAARVTDAFSRLL